MRASFYEGAGRFTTSTVAVPKPAAHEALLRVRRVGICGTDLHIFQGHLDHRVPRGGVIGHETFAEVVDAPAGSGYTRGDRVVVEPVLSCGRCRACTMGASYLCYELKILGVDAPGGMREFYPAPADRLIKVPASLSDDEAAVIEPLTMAVFPLLPICSAMTSTSSKPMLSPVAWLTKYWRLSSVLSESYVRTLMPRFMASLSVGARAEGSLGATAITSNFCEIQLSIISICLVTSLLTGPSHVSSIPSSVAASFAPFSTALK